MLNSKTLFIIVSNYPYGPGEPFLETELKYIANKFHKIYFLVTASDLNSKKEKCFYLPENSELIFLNNTPTLIQKFFIFRYLFNKDLYKEFFIIKNKYQIPINLHIFKIIFYTLIRSNLFLKNLKKILSNLNIENNNCLFYSYWSNEFTFALAQFKQSCPQVKTLTRTHGYDLYFERHTPPYPVSYTHLTLPTNREV